MQFHVTCPLFLHIPPPSTEAKAMMIHCKKHGLTIGCHVSPGLAQKIASGLPISKNDYVKIDYEFDDGYRKEIAFIFHFTSEDAARFGLLHSEKLPLSEYDKHQEFVDEIKPECFKCLQELLVD